jgi:signal transduction histidine kinase
MVKLKMRTKFLLSMLLISVGLTCTSLLLVRRSVQAQVRMQILADLGNSVSTFQNFQRERELTLTRAAELVADLPILRALMTTPHAHEATIQDASDHLWRLAGSDLFVLADRQGHVVALHTASPGLTREMAQASFMALNEEGPQHWWFGGQHLYEVFLRPIYFGPASENALRGFLVVGYEIDDKVAAQVSRIAASQVAFYYGENIVRSTLPPLQEAELSRQQALRLASAGSGPEEIQLGEERFLSTSLELAHSRFASVRLSVFKSFDQATAFLDSLNRLLLAVGLAAIVAGSALVFLISHTFTRPLGNLVAGVRALERGDFSYRLEVHSGDEAAELTGTFNRMRDSLLKTQQELLEAERLATIGRMASSISHDLRHALAAIVANAEFLCESRLSSDQREELYQEIRIAVNQMTDLIDSLLEFSRTRESLRRTYGKVRDSVEHALQSIRSRPEFHQIRISVAQEGDTGGWFDAKKLERAFYNLLLNACEAVTPETGSIRVELRGLEDAIEVRVSDNGRGIPEAIQGELFQSFVSHGKENGTGLGLTVVQKILQDHGGDVTVENTSTEGTVFRLVLPRVSSSQDASLGIVKAQPTHPSLVQTKEARSE